MNKHLQQIPAAIPAVNSSNSTAFNHHLKNFTPILDNGVFNRRNAIETHRNLKHDIGGVAVNKIRNGINLNNIAALKTDSSNSEPRSKIEGDTVTESIDAGVEGEDVSKEYVAKTRIINGYGGLDFNQLAPFLQKIPMRKESFGKLTV